MSHDLLRTIRRWQSRLTGLPDTIFEDRSLEALLDEAAQWHGKKIIAEQMVALLVAQTMVEHEAKAKDLALYFGSREARATPLGRFNFATGLAEWPGLVMRLFLPLLKLRGYRPFLRAAQPNETAHSILGLCKKGIFARAGLDPGDIADGLYARGLSPSTAMKALRTLLSFAEADPEAERALLRAIVATRAEADKLEIRTSPAEDVAVSLELLSEDDEPTPPV